MVHEGKKETTVFIFLSFNQGTGLRAFSSREDSRNGR